MEHRQYIVDIISRPPEAAWNSAVWRDRLGPPLVASFLLACLLPADQSTGKAEKRLVDIGALLVAYFQATKPIEPRERPLDHPPVSPQPFTRLDATAGYSS